MSWIDFVGYLAALTVLATFCMDTIVPLRGLAIASNVLFILYGIAGHLYQPLRHRLNALALAGTDQSRHVERAHLSPCFVTQPIQKRLEPTSELVSPIRRPANHGRPLQKADHP